MRETGVGISCRVLHRVSDTRFHFGNVAVSQALATQRSIFKSIAGGSRVGFGVFCQSDFEGNFLCLFLGPSRTRASGFRVDFLFSFDSCPSFARCHRDGVSCIVEWRRRLTSVLRFYVGETCKLGEFQE